MWFHYTNILLITQVIRAFLMIFLETSFSKHVIKSMCGPFFSGKNAICASASGGLHPPAAYQDFALTVFSIQMFGVL